MKVPIHGPEGKEGEAELPPVFEWSYRPDLINRVFWSLFTHSLQPKGVDPMAGKRTSAESRGTGLGIARMARVKGYGYPRAGAAAGVAGVKGGRQAHPPRSEKRIWKRVNKKERWLATASAIASTAMKEVVEGRGHRVDGIKALPLVVDDEIEGISRAKELLEVLEKLGLTKEFERIRKGIKRLSGKSRLRGRGYRVPKGPLIVVAEDKGIGKAVGSIPGLESVLAKDLSVLHLAPGGTGGRLVIWSASALKSLPKGVLRLAEALA